MTTIVHEEQHAADEYFARLHSIAHAVITAVASGADEPSEERAYLAFGPHRRAQDDRKLIEVVIGSQTVTMSVPPIDALKEMEEIAWHLILDNLTDNPLMVPDVLRYTYHQRALYWASERERRSMNSMIDEANSRGVTMMTLLAHHAMFQDMRDVFGWAVADPDKFLDRYNSLVP